MPMPEEYQRAGKAFDAFLCDARDALGHATRNQAYTTVQGVLLTFRRRLTIEEGLAFANVLPAVLRAMFVADWDLTNPVAPFASREVLTREVQGLRRDHNFAPDTAIADVAGVLRKHADEDALEAVLSTLSADAQAFWLPEG